MRFSRLMAGGTFVVVNSTNPQADYRIDTGTSGLYRDAPRMPSLRP
jgi:hypothetical protein